MAGLTPVLGAWLQRGEFFGVRGQRLFVIREGRGPVLMLLHGYPTSSWDWHRIWTPLTAHFTLVAPDLLGMGFSAKPAHHSYSLNAQADLVDALAQRLGIHHMHVLAHDLGVTVAQELLARRQADGSLPRIDSLVLLNGGVCPEAYEPRPIQRLLISPLGRWLGPRIPQRSFERAITSVFAPGSPPAQDLLDNFWALVSHGHGRRVTHQVGKLWHLSAAPMFGTSPARRLTVLQRRGEGQHAVNGQARARDERRVHMDRRWRRSPARGPRRPGRSWPSRGSARSSCRWRCCPRWGLRKTPCRG
jgi:pimeloyl-ACP methyl ester carboxylesterase